MQEHLTAPKLNTPQEQADQMRCCLRHLDNLRHKRLIPFIRLGRSIRYDPVAAHKALQKLTIKEQ
jgi:hypothetical protein